MKIKSKINILFGGLIVMSLLSSCNNDPYDFPPATEKPVVTFTGTQQEYTMTEGDTILLSFKTSRPITELMHFKFILDTAQATAAITDLFIGDGPIEYGFGDAAQAYIAEIPAFTETFTIAVTVPEDFILEETETMRVRMDEVKSRNAMIIGDQFFTFNIEQPVSDILTARMLWSGTYVGIDGETYNFADTYDLDLLILDSAFGYANNFESATAGHPEVATIAPSDLADGDYYIVTSYYAAPTAGDDNFPDITVEATPESIPLSLQFAKKGVYNQTLDLSGLYTDITTATPTSIELAAMLNVQGSTFTLTDPEGAVIAQGLTEDLATILSKNK